MKYQHPIHLEYYADHFGNLYRNGKLIKGCLTKTGYRQYRINGRSVLGHRVLVECWYATQLNEDQVINHKNLNRSDNTIDNLEVVDQAENIRHYWRNYGDIDMSEAVVKNSAKSGEKHHNARLTSEQVIAMIKGFSEGLTNSEASKLYGVHERYVSLIRHKKRWKSVWVELGLECSETIPSGSRAISK